MPRSLETWLLGIKHVGRMKPASMNGCQGNEILHIAYPGTYSRYDLYLTWKAEEEQNIVEVPLPPMLTREVVCLGLARGTRAINSKLAMDLVRCLLFGFASA